MSTSFLAVLIVAALFWGNCFSCPQLLLLMTQHQAAHGCCKRTAPASRTCATYSLKHFVQANPVVVAPPAVVPADIEHFVPALGAADFHATAFAQDSPPLSLELNPVIRI